MNLKRDKLGLYWNFNDQIRIYGQNYNEAWATTCIHAKWGGTCINCIHEMKGIPQDLFNFRLLQYQKKVAK